MGDAGLVARRAPGGRRVPSDHDLARSAISLRASAVMPSSAVCPGSAIDRNHAGPTGEPAEIGIYINSRLTTKVGSAKTVNSAKVSHMD